MSKDYGISDSKEAALNIPDLMRWGDHDAWKLIAKASSQEQGWMKSTKAMEVAGVGCLVQVTTQQGNNIAEALTFVPFVTIVEALDENGKVISRRLAMPDMENIPYE